MSFLIFILLLVSLILVHELGHFSVAKFFKIKVDEFGIFFPPRLFAWRRGETEYSLNTLPFGGFVKIFGEDANEGAGNPRSFASKNRFIQAAVLLAGIAMNLLFAWLILSAGYLHGMPASPQDTRFGAVRDAQPVIQYVSPDSPADKSGLEAGDKVLSIDSGTSALSERPGAQQVVDFIGAHAEESLVLAVSRDGEEKIFVARPEEGLIEGRKALGIQVVDIGVLQLPLHAALLEGGLRAWDLTVSTAQGLVSFFRGLVSGSANFQEVAGPIGIVSIGAQAVDSGFSAAVMLTALISINLALINLLPIPGLDGGRLLITALEGLFRRKLPERLVLGLTVTGLVALVGLMLIVSYFDIARLLG